MAGGALLPAAARACEVDVRAAGGRLRARLRRLRRRLRLDRHLRARCRTRSTSAAAAGTSISKLQKKVDQAPAGQAVAGALSRPPTRRSTTARLAIASLIAYTSSTPKDQDALLDLAGQYQQLAQQYSTDYSSAQQQAVSGQLPSSVFAPAANTALGKAFADPSALKDPIGSAIQTQATEAENTALQNYQSATANAVDAYKKIASPEPERPVDPGAARRRPPRPRTTPPPRSPPTSAS